MHDIVIANGLVVDGTGGSPDALDVVIDDGRVTAVVTPSSDVTGRRRIDATGCIVTPGFIDPHTHFDAQLWWDGAATPSAYHGVTSIAIGSCGFGVAPCVAGDEEFLLRSLEAVEEIPYESTRLGVPFSWRTWPEFFDGLAELDLGVNVAGFVPHSTLRTACSPGPGDGLVDREVRQLIAALEAGALGLSSSRGRNHRDASGRPMASRLASDEELARLVAAVGDRVWQINLEAKGAGDVRAAAALTSEVDRYTAMTGRGGRLSWTPFVVQPGDQDGWRAILDHNHRLNERAHVAPQVAPQPMAGAILFAGPSTAAIIEGWAEAWSGYGALERGEKEHRLADASFRSMLRRAPAGGNRMMAPCYDRWTISVSLSRPEVVGLTLEQLGALDSTHPADAMLDLALADGLATQITVPFANVDHDPVVGLVADPTTLIGLGDAGAHVNSISNFTYPTYLLASLVRDEAVLPLETAVAELTSRPAAVLGIGGRGTLEPGTQADVCVVDLGRLAVGPPELRTDLPGGAARLVKRATGYRYVLVNGEIVVDGDRLTGSRPGCVIRA